MSYASIARVYENLFKQYGATCKGVDWPNQEETEIRYSEILKPVTDESTVLDFGCGYAGLLEHIKRHRPSIQYYGLEINQPQYEYCLASYPQTKFFLCDVLKEDHDLHFDFVVMNGVLTAKYDLSFDEMYDYSNSLIEECYKICKFCLSVNFTSPFADKKNDKLFYPSLSQVGDIASRITKKFSINHNYLEFEQCLYLYK
jgi:SAM-dependent methyltransferase